MFLFWFDPFALIPPSSHRKPGQLQVLPAAGFRDCVTHRRAPPAGGAIRQALPHARIL